VARVAGETAPLLFTSLGNNAWSTDLTKPMASLPLAIYAFAGSPFEDWIALAWAGALLITLSVLLLNILARTVLRTRK
jgi:phosphate transport system permease protein